MNDNQGRSNFDKIIVVDVNPGNDELTKELIIGKFSKVIKNVSSYQHVVLMSHSNLHLLLKLVSDVGLKNGFLISDYGARIYDLKNNRIIYENAIGQTEVNAIVHYGIMQNALVLASGETREYAYSLDQLNAIALQKRHYLPLLYTNDYAKFSKFIHSLPTFSIMLFQKRRTTMLANFEELNHVIKDWNVTINIGQSSYFIATDVNSTKYQALLRVIEHVKITNFDCVYYYAINSIDEQCLKSFKNHLIHQEIAFNSNYINEFDIQANVDEISDRMYRLTFVNAPTYSNSKKFHTEEVINKELYTEIMQTANITKKNHT